ncbi:dihydroxyacetone kinase [Rickenella mellea]|uniref:Dihydroxyacetone kinase n=1 Tax=Rickenella mellea TaxID=50990 RepID=A0A4Y7Q8D8_9AGAM|nr:dihydroxyacetone kinase [Rickenella mellea]
MTLTDKHFLNSPLTLVLDSLRGLCALNPNVCLDEANKVVYQANPDRSKVAIICGGGSGHEPSHAGFVGNGILNGAICGNVFASPNAGQVRRGIDLVSNSVGTVIIVKNYTGDVLNFGLAKEQYAALYPDKIDRLKFIIVGDDVSVGRTQGQIVGRRGLAGTVLVYKIAGALARQGASLEEVHSVAQWVASRIGTVGVGLEHCHIPGTESSSAHLNATEVEIGMGIHNEPGHTRITPIPPLDKLVHELVELVVNMKDPERSFLDFKDSGNEVVLLVNNLGGLSELELGAVVGATVQNLNKRGIKIQKVLGGTFMTSLNMPGFSLTLLLLRHSSEPNAPDTQRILSLLDESTDAPGWKWSSLQPPQIALDKPVEAANTANKDLAPEPRKIHASNTPDFAAAVEKACKALIAAEPDITRMDSIAGDGDCGLTLKSGAEAVLEDLTLGKINGSDVIGSVLAISKAAEEHMAGTSGALYSIFFSSLVQGLVSASDKTSSATAELWAAALNTALERLYTYTRARPPSRTLVDPLAAFVKTFSSNLSSQDAFASAVSAAGKAAEATKDIEAKAGRSAYIDAQQLQIDQVPDPGAWGVKVILESLQK